MIRRRVYNNRKDVVSASELAQAATCEQQLMFDLQDGRKRSRDQEQKAARGVALHERMHSDARRAYQGVETSVSDRRCFIASAVFGPQAAETNFLRRFRDHRLLPTWHGRLLVSGYYFFSPPLAIVLRRWPLGATLARAGLRSLIWILDRKPPTRIPRHSL